MSFVERSGKNSWRVRYWRDDGTHGSLSGFPTRKAAELKARELDLDRRRGEFLDPDAGNLTLNAWVDTWFDTLDVGPATLAQYRSLARCHIQPRWGTTALNDISGLEVRVWAKKLRTAGYATATITTILKVLTMMLADAVDERLIRRQPDPPATPRPPPLTNRPRKPCGPPPPRPIRVALNAARLAGPDAALLILTAAWTGARWGELTGLHRDNIHLTTQHRHHQRPRRGRDRSAHVGALHEVDQPAVPRAAQDRRIRPHDHAAPVPGRPAAPPPGPHATARCSPPATARSARDRTFPAARCAPPPTAPSTGPAPAVVVSPTVPGLTFHGLRHSHKTWMIADQIPEVAQARRLGHRIPDKIQHVYSHVAPELETRLLDALQHRWTESFGRTGQQELGQRRRATPRDTRTSRQIRC